MPSPSGSKNTGIEEKEEEERTEKEEDTAELIDDKELPGNELAMELNDEVLVETLLADDRLLDEYDELATGTGTLDEEELALLRLLLLPPHPAKARLTTSKKQMTEVFIINP